VPGPAPPQKQPPKPGETVASPILDPRSVAVQVIDKLRILSGQLAAAVASKDQARTIEICEHMTSLIDVLDQLSIPDGGPDLANLRRHTHFPGFYAAKQDWKNIGSDPADCLTDIAGVSSRVARVGKPREPWWAEIHPSVRAVAEPRYVAGHRADAVEAALKEVNNRVKREYKNRTGVELDGKSLMMKAFSPDVHQIVLADQTTESGKNEQEGYMFLSAGAMQALRNPKAHANLDIDERRAMHHLAVASLLMFKLDEVKVPV
jgi:uncharacterized protein (TIGR02391 family)